MLEDRFGQTLSTDSDAAVGEYIRGMDLLLSSNLGALEAVDTAINEDSDFALAHALRARALQMLARIPEAKSAINRAVDLLTRATPREQAHIQVLVYLLDGRGSEALTALRAHLANYPRDALPLSLALGVYGLIGFSGRLDHYEMQRDLLLQLAPHWGDDWWFNTYLGWSLVETGECVAGADLLDASLAVNPRNASAAHGRAHGYYEMGEAEAGLQFIDSWLSTYDPASPLHCHLAWHAAMFAFHLGDAERAMSEYAQYIRPENAHSSPMFTLIDNAAFLWRALTYGHPLCTSDSQKVVDYTKEHFPDAGLAFVNVHSAMALAVSGDRDAMQRHLSQIGELVARDMQPPGRVGGTIAEGFEKYGAKDFSKSSELLSAALPELERIGGSHAQGDVVIDCLISAYLHSGDRAAAEAVLTQRSSSRACHLNQDWLDRLEAALGPI